MLNTSKDCRIMQAKELISRVPVGKAGAYKRSLMYELANKYGIVMTETQLSTFLVSGYSSVATEILIALEIVVNRMIIEEENFQKKILELQNA